MFEPKKYYFPMILLKKHYCADCNTKLKRKRHETVVNSNSPEARDYDFSIGDMFILGDMTFIRYTLECPNCKREYQLDEIRRLKI